MEEIRVHPRCGCGPGTNRAVTEPGHPPGAALPDGTAEERAGSTAAGQRHGAPRPALYRGGEVPANALP